MAGTLERRQEDSTLRIEKFSKAIEKAGRIGNVLDDFDQQHRIERAIRRNRILILRDPNVLVIELASLTSGLSGAGGRQQSAPLAKSHRRHPCSCNH